MKVRGEDAEAMLQQVSAVLCRLEKGGDSIYIRHGAANVRLYDLPPKDAVHYVIGFIRKAIGEDSGSGIMTNYHGKEQKL